MITVILKGGSKVWVDFEIDKSHCKGCRKQIYWATTENAKKMPICQDDKGNWVSHFYNCPKASFFRKKKPHTLRTNGVDSISEFDNNII